MRPRSASSERCVTRARRSPRPPRRRGRRPRRASAPGRTRGERGSTRTGGGSTKVTLAADGKRVEVDVDLEALAVTVAGQTFPVRIVSNQRTKVELEIAGETVVVDGWPEGFASPAAAVAVNGELHTITVERVATGGPGPAGPSPTPAPSVPPTEAPAPAPTPSDAVAVAPPMPGKVVEVRV